MRKSLAKFGIESQNNNLSLSTRNSALNYPKSPLQCQTDKPMNIVMLVVDSLRADVLTQDVMPNSWALQPNAQMFNQHFSTGNATRYGMFGLMYGLPGNYWLPMLDERRGSALFTATQQLGYQHFIYGSAPLTNPEFDRTVFAELKAPLHEGSHKTSDLNDQEISDAFRKELQQRNPQQPFFGLVFFDAPHAYALPDAYKHKFEPMLPSVNYMDLNNNFDPKPFFNRYKASVNYDDALIGDILKTLSQEQLLENTLVIITGDHGQEFNDSRKNFWGHNSNFTPWQTHVPLLMLWPHKSANQYTQTSSHTDIVPTLLKNALGCTTPIENYSTGIDLFGTLPETRTLLIESWTERAIRHGNQLYVFDALGTLSQLDAAYNTLENQPVDTLVIQQAFGQMQQFKQ
jgi:membrane-anchored protein YejM (alkaline phosphatase superfamily)